MTLTKEQVKEMALAAETLGNINIVELCRGYLANLETQELCEHNLTIMRDRVKPVLGDGTIAIPEVLTKLRGAK